MNSLREQIMVRVAAALLNATPAGSNVFRSREVALTRQQSPAIVVVPAGNELQRLAAQVDRNGFDVRIEIFTRGDPWDSLADPIDVAAHQILMSDAQLAALVSDVRRTGEEFEAQEADRTAGTLTVNYRLTFLTAAGDITRQP